MALEDGVEEVVTILTSYFLDGGKELVEMYGDQAPQFAAEMGAVMEERLNEDTPFGPLWEEFKRDPVANQAEVIGALEMLEEVQPELALRLEGYYAAFQELDQPGVQNVYETSEPEDTINATEIEAVKSYDDFDDNDEYREENTYLVGNVEDRSTSPLYIEGLDTSIDPNETSQDEDTNG